MPDPIVDSQLFFEGVPDSVLSRWTEDSTTYGHILEANGGRGVVVSREALMWTQEGFYPRPLEIFEMLDNLAVLLESWVSLRSDHLHGILDGEHVLFACGQILELDHARCGLVWSHNESPGDAQAISGLQLLADLASLQAQSCAQSGFSQLVRGGERGGLGLGTEPGYEYLGTAGAGGQHSELFHDDNDAFKSERHTDGRHRAT